MNQIHRITAAYSSEKNAKKKKELTSENKANDMRLVMTAWATAVLFHRPNYSDYILQVQKCTRKNDAHRAKSTIFVCVRSIFILVPFLPSVQSKSKIYSQR